MKYKMDPLADGISMVEYIQHVGNDKMIVNAARVSYASENDEDVEFGEKDSKLLKFLIENDHSTPLEHNLITFKITAPLYVIQEMLRHRIGTSFNQESHRYVVPGKKQEDVMKKFYVPIEFRKQDMKNKQGSTGFFDKDKNKELQNAYRSACLNSFKIYEALISEGVAREIARGVLPHCTYSSLYFTLNMRSLIHFLKLRLAPNAQYEIRCYAECMEEIARKIFPNTFNILEQLETFKRV